MGWLSLFSTAASGCLLVHRWPPVARHHPRWMWLLTMGALGCAAGLGLGSCLFFLLVWAGLASTASVLAADAGLLIVAALLWRGRPSQPRREAHGTGLTPSDTWILRAAGVLVMILLLSGWRVSSEASPHGEWDALAIWNLRAKFLASGNAGWKHAVSPVMAVRRFGASHPEYPLLVSGLVAQGWMLSGSSDTAFPMVIGLAFALMLMALLAGALAWLRDERTGWIALLLLGGSELFASQIAAQYADIPLACYALGAVALLAAAQLQPAAPTLVWAGVFAALGAWTKNEGLVLVLLALAWCAWRIPARRLPAFLAGAAPVLAVVLCFKFMVAPATKGLFPATATEALEKLADPQRAWLIFRSYALTLWEAAPWWAHPLALAPLWIWAAGLVEPGRRRQVVVAAVPLGMLTADFLVYMLTTADLRWLLSTSVNRLWLQLWPSLLLSLLLAAGTEPLQHLGPVTKPRTQPERRSRRKKA